MSHYFQKELFLEPSVQQYGSNMVMTNVIKPKKKKYLNIDTKYSDNSVTYNSTTVANFNLTLSERLTDVREISVRNVEFPMSIYNISSELGNNYFKITDLSNGVSHVVEVAPGEYNEAALVNEINTKINAIGGVFSNLQISIMSHFTTVFLASSTPRTFSLDFSINRDGSHDRFHFKRKMGWLLGYRLPNYVVRYGSGNIVSENMVDLTGLRYVYLVLDEYNNMKQNSFNSMLHKSLINKNIIAKISFNKSTFGFGSVLPANNYNGYLLTDVRNYGENGKADIQKLNIQVVDDIGNPVAMGGQDFSFCLEIVHE